MAAGSQMPDRRSSASRYNISGSGECAITRREELGDLDDDSGSSSAYRRPTLVRPTPVAELGRGTYPSRSVNP